MFERCWQKTVRCSNEAGWCWCHPELCTASPRTGGPGRPGLDAPRRSEGSSAGALAKCPVLCSPWQTQFGPVVLVVHEDDDDEDDDDDDDDDDLCEYVYDFEFEWTCPTPFDFCCDFCNFLSSFFCQCFGTQALPRLVCFYRRCTALGKHPWMALITRRRRNSGDMAWHCMTTTGGACSWHGLVGSIFIIFHFEQIWQNQLFHWGNCCSNLDFQLSFKQIVVTQPKQINEKSFVSIFGRAGSQTCELNLLGISKCPILCPDLKHTTWRWLFVVLPRLRWQEKRSRTRRWGRRTNASRLPVQHRLKSLCPSWGTRDTELGLGSCYWLVFSHPVTWPHERPIVFGWILGCFCTCLSHSVFGCQHFRGWIDPEWSICRLSVASSSTASFWVLKWGCFKNKGTKNFQMRSFSSWFLTCHQLEVFFCFETNHCHKPIDCSWIISLRWSFSAPTSHQT